MTAAARRCQMRFTDLMMRHGPPPELVSRAAERETLRSAVEECRRGTGRMVVLLGEAGAGKSVLLRDAEALALRIGLTVRRGQCRQGAGPLRPLVEALLAVGRCDMSSPRLRPYRTALAAILPGEGPIGSPPRTLFWPSARACLRRSTRSTGTRGRSCSWTTCTTRTLTLSRCWNT